MSDATQEFIERLANGECGTSLIECVILDLKILNNYRREMDKMEKVFKDTEMPFEGSEGDYEFHGIDDLEDLAEAFVELKTGQEEFLAAIKHTIKVVKKNQDLEHDNCELEDRCYKLEGDVADLEAENEKLKEFFRTHEWDKNAEVPFVEE